MATKLIIQTLQIHNDEQTADVGAEADAEKSRDGRHAIAEVSSDLLASYYCTGAETLRFWPFVWS